MICVAFDQDDFLNVYNALDKVRAVVDAIAENTLRHFAILTAATLKRNILAQTYGDYGQPHAETWSKRKGNDTYWRQTDALLNSIIGNKVSPQGLSNTSYFAGVPAGVMNGSKEILDYAFSLEYGGGSSGTKPRPLFHNTMEDLMPFYMEKFLASKTLIFEVWS